MITHPAYFNSLCTAIDTGSLSAVRSTLDRIRALRLGYAPSDRRGGGGTTLVAWAATAALVDVRGDQDCTALMYACLRYHELSKQGRAAESMALDRIVGYLIEVGAVLMAEGGRPVVRTVASSVPTFKRGRGRNLIDLLGEANLPPSARQVIRAVDDFDHFERRAYNRWEDQVAA